MKKHNKHLTALLAGVLSLLMLSACGSTPQESDSGLQTPVQSEADVEIPPADTGVYPRSSFNIPHLGLSFSLTQAMQDAMLKKELYMGAQESLSEDGTAIQYALLTWDALTEAQKSETIANTPEAFDTWRSGLNHIAALGVYDAAHAEQLDALTGLTEHTLLGENGGFQYYFSIDPSTRGAEVLEHLGTKLYAPVAMVSGDSAFSLRKTDITNLGIFTMQDLDGNTYTQEMFAENKLTMVNLFATWCNPCVKEIPDLEKLRSELADQGFGIVGVVLDGADQLGNPVPEAISKAHELADKTGASYPFLLPDSSGMNGRLAGVDAVPETFFVDSEGNIVGQVYLGAHSLADWTEIVEIELGHLKGAN